MKKLLSASLVVLALAAAGATVYLTQKPKLDARAASVTSGYLPASTLVLLSLPDPGQTAEDWKTTDLYKLWTEPQVQAFFAKPLSKVPASDKETGEIWAQVQRLDPKNLFVAMTSLEEKNNRPHLIGGFQFTGKPEDVNNLLAKPKEAMRRKSPDGKADLQSYQGHSIETFTDSGGETLASVFSGQWYLVGNDVAVLKSTLDHLEGRAPAADTTLEKDADFQAVSAKLPKGHASLIFARTQLFMDKVFALSEASGQAVDPEQRAEAKKLKAIGATTAIEKGKIHDTIYVLAPGHKTPETKLALSALPLTSPDTLLYIGSALNLPANYKLPNGATAGPGAEVYQALASVFKGLEEKGVTLEKFRTAFGRELTFQLDWPAATGAQPSVLISLDVRDKAAATTFADGLASVAGSSGTWQKRDKDGLSLHVLSFEGVRVVSPTYVVTDKHFVLGLSEAGVATAAGREKAGGPNFTASQAYKDSVASVSKATDAFGYVDTRTLFERTYNAFKPMAALSAMMYPQSADYVEVSKLPDAETVSKHLSPIAYSTSNDAQGMLIDSTGPVTFLQAQIGLIGAVGAAAVPVLQKQFGAFGPKGAPAADTPGEDEADAPAATPESTPAATP